MPESARSRYGRSPFAGIRGRWGRRGAIGVAIAIAIAIGVGVGEYEVRATAGADVTRSVLTL